MRHVQVPAPAKINLHLEILGRRDDGFHALETVFQTVALADLVGITLAPGDGGPDIALTCDDPGLPTGPGNLAWQAAAGYLALRPELGRVAIDLAKRLPHGAGLGGGSSDAAAVLRGLAALDPTPPDRAALAALALRLGSDVPFFLVGGTAHATGRGEELTPLPPAGMDPVTIFMPDAILPTPAVFKALTDGERGPRQARGPAWFASAPRADWLYNRLTGPARRLCPPVAALLDWLAGQGVPHLMTGSGAACVAFGAIAPPPGVRAWTTRLAPGLPAIVPGSPGNPPAIAR